MGERECCALAAVSRILARGLWVGRPWLGERRRMFFIAVAIHLVSGVVLPVGAVEVQGLGERVGVQVGAMVVLSASGAIEDGESASGTWVVEAA